MRVCLPRSTNNVTFAHKIEIYINTKHSFIMKMRNLLALAAAIVGFATVSNAQETEKSYYPYPYMFVGVQGGVQNTFNNDYNNWNLHPNGEPLVWRLLQQVPRGKAPLQRHLGQG